jgi:hypothetical protein
VSNPAAGLLLLLLCLISWPSGASATVLIVHVMAHCYCLKHGHAISLAFTWSGLMIQMGFV